MNRFVFYAGLGYVAILFAFTFFVFPANDTFYYWTWSTHLQLSYFDGPPLIAYLIYLSTHIFGNNCFALELIATLSISASAYLIYRIVNLSTANKLTASCAALLFMTYPFATTRFMAISMTLDCLEVVSSLLILYLSFCFIKYQHIRYIYLLGIACGLGLLAKYNVIILIVALLLHFALQRDLRKIYHSIHLYLAMLIALGIFSPVLIWNYQHHWISFLYQLNSHTWHGGANAINAKNKHGLMGVWFYLSSCVFGVLNIWLIIFLSTAYAKYRPHTSSIYTASLQFVIIFMLFFWLVVAYFAHVGLNYMVTISSLMVILLSEQLVTYKTYRLIKVLIILFSLISLIMLIDKSHVHKADMANYQHYIQSGLIKTILSPNKTFKL